MTNNCQTKSEIIPIDAAYGQSAVVYGDLNKMVMVRPLFTVAQNDKDERDERTQKPHLSIFQNQYLPRA